MIPAVEPAAVRFDYTTVAPELAALARKAADRFRGRVRAAYLDTGRDLIEIKEAMGHGKFGTWIKAELGLTPRTAEHCMNAARFLADKSETLSHLPPTVIYALAAPSAPAAVVEQVVAAAGTGAALPVEEIKAKLAEAAAERREVQRVVKAKPGRTEDEARKVLRRIKADRERARVKFIDNQARERAEREAAEEAARGAVRRLVAQHPEVMAAVSAILTGPGRWIVEKTIRDALDLRQQESSAS